MVEENTQNLTEKTASGIIWKFAERIGAQLVSLIVSLLLARVLFPDDYQVVSIVTILITVCNVFVSYGFGNALIQKKNADNVDFSSVLYAGVALSLVLYAILFFLAPLIADFYNIELITPVLRIMALRIPIAAVNSVQQAFVARKMIFKKFFFATLIGTVVSGVVGLVMVYTGCGVWSLVAQYLTNVVIDTFILGVTIKWKPCFILSFKRLKSLMSYGWKLLFSGLIDTGYNELRGLIIGKMDAIAGSTDLSYYENGKKYPSLISVNVSASFSAVLFAAMSKVQDDREKVKRITQKSIRVCSYVLSPMMVGFACVAETFVRAVLTDKWLPAVPFLRIMCFVYLMYPIHTANLEAIKAMGRSDLFLTLEIIKKAVGITALVISMWFGVLWIAISSLITTVIASFINAFPNKKLLGYKYHEQIIDLLPGFILSALMGVPIFFMSYIPINPWIILGAQMVAGVAIYLLLSVITKNDSFLFIKGYIKKFLKKRKNQTENNSCAPDKNNVPAEKDDKSKDKKDVKEAKRLLLLGGSPQQVVAIVKAKEEGYYTVLCDYLPDNPGKDYADKFYLVSTTDKKAVLKVAVDERVDGVIAYASDPAATTAAYVAEKMGLKTNPLRAVEILGCKSSFRKYLKKKGFNVPKSVSFNNLNKKIEEKISGLTFPVMIKPVDSSGSKGVSKIESIEKLPAAVQYALSFSRAKKIEAEEYIEKDGRYLIGGDVFVSDGEVVFWGLLNCHRDTRVNPLVPVGKSYPVCGDKEDLNKIKGEIKRLIKSLKIRFGAFNVEMIISGGKPYFIELGPRNGGNMIPDLLTDISGKDMIKASVKYALGEKTDISFDGAEKYYATHNLHVTEDGILEDIIFDEVAEKYVYKKNIVAKAGDKVSYFDYSSKTLGIIFMKFPDEKSEQEFLENIYSHIKIVLRKEN